MTEVTISNRDMFPRALNLLAHLAVDWECFGWVGDSKNPNEQEIRLRLRRRNVEHGEKQDPT